MIQSSLPLRGPRPRVPFRGPALLVLGLLLRGSALPAEEPRPGPPLQDGFTFEHTLQPGEVFAFPVEMKEGEYLRAEVDQIGIDLVVRLVDEQGKEVAQADCISLLPTSNEKEHLAAISPKDARLSLRIEAAGRPRTDPALPASFRLRAIGPREPSPSDQAFLAANDRSHRASVTYFGAVPGADRRGYQAAADLFDQTVTEFRALGEEGPLAYSLLWSGTAKHEGNLGGWPETLAQLTEATALFRKGEYRELKQQLERSLEFSAFVLGRMHAWDAALPLLDEAIAIAQSVRDQTGLVAMYTLRGRAYSGLGQFEEADASLRIALEECGTQRASQACQAREMAAVYTALATNFTDWGRYQEALSAYGSAKPYLTEAKRPWLEAIALNNLGELYARLGEQRRAIRLYSEAVEIFNRIGQTDDAAIALTNVAAAYKFLGEPQKAKALYESVLSTAGVSPNSVSNALHCLAYLYIQDLDDPRKGIELAERAIGESRKNRLQEAYGRHARALGLRLLKNFREARAELESVLLIVREIGERSLEAEALLSLARVDRDEGLLEASRDDALAAIQVVEALRQGIRFNPSLRASFLALQQAQYEFYIDSLMLLHQVHPTSGYLERAFEASETARARTLLESLARLPSRSFSSSSPSSQGRLSLLSKLIGDVELERQRAISGESPAASPEAQLASLDDLLLKYEDELGQLQESGSKVSFATPGSLPFKDLRSRALSGDAVLLNYFLGSERSHLWIVHPKGMEAVELPPRERIEKLARHYYDLLTARNRQVSGESREAKRERIAKADLELKAASSSLAEILLKPVATRLAVLPSTLMVVSDGTLLYIPFGALPLPGRADHLIESTKIVHLPSASTLAALRDFPAPAPRSDTRMAVFAAPTYRGIPSLPWAEREALAISRLVPPDRSRVFLGPAASRQTLQELDLAQYSILHFGTHGLVDSEHPELSSLALSFSDSKGEPLDGYLRLGEIYGLHLNADLVTLSACKTALGKEIRGEGLVGLARGFLAAGARRVVASLWSVEDRATAKLMELFYRGMLKSKLAPSEALRRAQLAMLQDPHYRSPYYWAAFTLQGEWR